MTLLLEVLIFLAAALIVVPICHRFGLSAVLGYLIAGLLVGPSGFALIPDSEEVLHFAELGVVMLLFVIGLELQPRRLWVMRRFVFGLGTGQIGITTIIISGMCYGWLGQSLAASVLIGFALALSSTAFVLQLLGEQGTLYSPHGRAAFGTLLMQDVAVIPAIAAINILTTQPEQSASISWISVSLVVLLVIAARYALRPLLRIVAQTGINELFTAAALTLVVGAALGMVAAGLSMGLGAFVAGMIVADSEYRHQLEADIMPFKGLLLGLFFIAVGMSADLELLRTMPLTIFALTLLLMAIKAVVIFPLARLQKLTAAESLRTGAVLAQGGEFAFVLLTAGVSGAVLASEVADIVVIVITISMALTPLLVAIGRRLTNDSGTIPFDTIDAEETPVIIAGFGRFAQIVGRILTARKIPFTVLEADAKQVEFVRRYGNKTYYGDASRIEILRAAQVEKARAIVIAVDDEAASLRIAENVHATCPGVKIFARAMNRQHEIKLREFGADFVIRDTLRSSLGMAEELLISLGSDNSDAKRIVDAFAEHDAQTLDRQMAVYHDESEFRQSVIEAAEELKQLFQDDAVLHRKEPIDSHVASQKGTDKP